ncbi:MAG: esterase/lipase family protein [Myxococcota bacterium]
MTGAPTRLTALAALTTCLLSCGTARDLLRARGVENYETRYAVVAGTVEEAAGANDHWIVVWFANVPCDDDWDQLRDWAKTGRPDADATRWPPEIHDLSQRMIPKARVVQHVLRQGPGRWFADLAPGCYGVGAWSDRDGDYTYDSDEPAAAASTIPDGLLRVEERDRLHGIQIVIPEEGRLELDPMNFAVQSLEVRTHEDQLLTSLDALSVEGEVVELADERFGAASGRLGYWQPIEFCWQFQAGVYFLEPYDPGRIPVLFVHGALGYPQEFTTLIENLDRERYQPWFYFYPSGSYLGPVSELLAQGILRLQYRHGFDEMAVVAHSMGGLVARSSALRLHESVQEFPLRLFVSIATPWGGMKSARSGVKNSPIVVPSWRDVAAESPFLENLFFASEDQSGPEVPRKKLHQDVEVGMIFATKDKTIGLDTAIRWEAVRDAGERWPLPYDHVSILESPEASLVLGELLDRTFFD